MFVKYFIKLRQVIRIKFSQYLNRNLNIVCQIYLMIRTFFFHFSMKNKISSRSDTCLLIGAFFNWKYLTWPLLPNNNFERLGGKQQCCFVWRCGRTEVNWLWTHCLPPESELIVELSRRQLGGGHAGRWHSASQHGQEGQLTRHCAKCLFCSCFSLLPTSQQQNFNNRFPNFNWFSLEKSKAFFLCRAPHRLAETSRILFCQHPTNGTLIRWHQQTNNDALTSWFASKNFLVALNATLQAAAFGYP